MPKVHVRVLKISSEIKFKSTTYTKKELQTLSVEKDTPLKFEFGGDKKTLLECVFLGQELVIEYEIRGKRFDKKNDKGEIIGKDIINTLSAYKIKIV